MATQTVLAQRKLSVTGDVRIRFAEAFRSGRTSGKQSSQEETLVFPGLLKTLEAGNPLATYAAMIDLEPKYQQSKIFAGVYPEASA